MAAVNIEGPASAERRTWQAFFQDGLDDVFLVTMFLSWRRRRYRADGVRSAGRRRWQPSSCSIARCGRSSGGWPTVAPASFVPRGRAIFTDRRIVMLVVGSYAVTGLIPLIQSRNPSLPSLFPLVPFAMWVIVFLGRAWKTGRGRYYALSVVPGIAAAVAWPIEEGSLRDLPVPFGAIGLGLAASGAWALRDYLRTNPITWYQG